MGLDFWAVKAKKGLNENDFNCKNHWHLIEDDDIDDFLDEETLEFINKRWNDKDLYGLCHDTVGYFVGGDAINENSETDINNLSDKLNEFIDKNPEYIYKCRNEVIYTNEEIRKFIKYINIVRDNGFILWCSW